MISSETATRTIASYFHFRVQCRFVVVSLVNKTVFPFLFASALQCATPSERLSAAAAMYWPGAGGVGLPGSGVPLPGAPGGVSVPLGASTAPAAAGLSLVSAAAAAAMMGAGSGGNPHPAAGLQPPHPGAVPLHPAVSAAHGLLPHAAGLGLNSAVGMGRHHYPIPTSPTSGPAMVRHPRSTPPHPESRSVTPPTLPAKPVPIKPAFSVERLLRPSSPGPHVSSPERLRAPGSPDHGAAEREAREARGASPESGSPSRGFRPEARGSPGETAPLPRPRPLAPGESLNPQHPSPVPPPHLTPAQAAYLHQLYARAALSGGFPSIPAAAGFPAGFPTHGGIPHPTAYSVLASHDGSAK